MMIAEFQKLKALVDGAQIECTRAKVANLLTDFEGLVLPEQVFQLRISDSFSWAWRTESSVMTEGEEALRFSFSIFDTSHGHRQLFNGQVVIPLHHIEELEVTEYELSSVLTPSASNPEVPQAFSQLIINLRVSANAAVIAHQSIAANTMAQGKPIRRWTIWFESRSQAEQAGRLLQTMCSGNERTAQKKTSSWDDRLAPNALSPSDSVAVTRVPLHVRPVKADSLDPQIDQATLPRSRPPVVTDPFANASPPAFDTGVSVRASQPTSSGWKYLSAAVLGIWAMFITWVSFGLPQAQSVAHTREVFATQEKGLLQALAVGAITICVFSVVAWKGTKHFRPIAWGFALLLLFVWAFTVITGRNEPKADLNSLDSGSETDSIPAHVDVMTFRPQNVAEKILLADEALRLANEQPTPKNRAALFQLAGVQLSESAVMQKSEEERIKISKRAASAHLEGARVLEAEGFTTEARQALYRAQACAPPGSDEANQAEQLLSSMSGR